MVDFRRNRWLGILLLGILLGALGSGFITSWYVKKEISKENSELKETVQAQTDQLKDTLSALNTNIDVVNSNLKVLKEKVEDKTTFEQLQSSLDSVNIRITDLETKVNNVNTEIHIVQNGLENINPSFTSQYSYWDYRKYFSLNILISSFIGSLLGFSAFSFGLSLIEKHKEKKQKEEKDED